MRALQLNRPRATKPHPRLPALDISQTSELSPLFASMYIPFASLQDFEPDRGGRSWMALPLPIRVVVCGFVCGRTMSALATVWLGSRWRLRTFFQALA